jgi:sulfite exporter TauE/SafE
MKKLFNDWFTGPDNDNYEAGRFLWFISVLALIGYSGWHLYQNATFDAVQFGIAAAALIAAGGWGVGAKDRASAVARS